MSVNPPLHSTVQDCSSESKIPAIALAGVPNAGKTTLFNSLSGLHYKVANYPGVTVEKREGSFEIPDLGEAKLVDLPGTYSLFGGSPDEALASAYLNGTLKGDSPPNAIICVLDACNLERNLYLASQLIDSGWPVVLALTMTDVAKKRGMVIREELLSQAFDAPVVNVSGRKKENLEPLYQELIKALQKDRGAQKRYIWCDNQYFLDTAGELGKHYLKERVRDGHCADPISIGIGLLSGARKSGNIQIRREVSRVRKQLKETGIDPGSLETEQRYDWIFNVVKRSVAVVGPKRKSITEIVDRIVTHKVLGALIFIAIMTAMFQSVFTWATVPMDLIDGAFADLRGVVMRTLPPGQLRSLLADGIIAGVGSVLVFLPQIAVLYLFISVLEESGYLSRAAFLMDKLMRKVGLQGRSFIPLLSSFACAVPGIMATRSIPSFSHRMATIMIAPLMSCSARLPVYTLLIAAFIPSITVAGFFSLQGLVFLAMYLLGIIGASAIALVFRRTIFKGAPTHFVMEMPPYRLPQISNVLRAVWERIVVFVKNAGTIIVACSVVLWFLASYPRIEGQPPREAVMASYAGQIGKFIEPAIEPLGFDWKIGVSILASFAAREVFVSSMSLVHNLEGQDDDQVSDSLIAVIRDSVDPQTGKASYTALTALSLMVFYVFSCMCMATLAVCRRETGSWKWPLGMFVYMTIMAYAASFVTYQIGSLFV